MMFRYTTEQADSEPYFNFEIMLLFVYLILRNFYAILTHDLPTPPVEAEINLYLNNSMDLMIRICIAERLKLKNSA